MKRPTMGLEEAATLTVDQAHELLKTEERKHNPPLWKGYCSFLGHDALILTLGSQPRHRRVLSR
jgi:hypothetical protein